MLREILQSSSIHLFSYQYEEQQSCDTTEEIFCDLSLAFKASLNQFSDTESFIIISVNSVIIT